MYRHAAALPCVALLAWLGGTLGASALIKIEFPVARFYSDSKTVRAAVVTSVDAAHGVIELKPTNTFKGGAAPARLRLLLVAPTDLLPRVAVNQPVALFGGPTDGQGAAIVHLADTWLLAQGEPDATPPTLRIVQKYDAARAFPGRTAALVRLLTAMQAGPSPLADKIEQACLGGGVREIANLAVKPTFLESMDLNQDTRPDLLVGTAEGAKLFLAAGTGYTDATTAWGLSGLTAAHATSGDVNADGRPDLLLGTNLLVRQGDTFIRADTTLPLPPEAEWLAVALADVTRDGKADIVVLLKSGERVTLTNPGTAGKPWTRSARQLWEGDSGVAAQFAADWGENATLHVLVARRGGLFRYAAAADGEPETSFPQLTGTAWPPKLTLDGQPAGAVKCVALDLDGNGQRDALLLTSTSGITLLNRGFGAYYTDNAIHFKLRPQPPAALPFALTPGTLLAGGACQPDELPRQNLLVLTEEGRLYELINTPVQKP
jgi:hypothetical protein